MSNKTRSGSLKSSNLWQLLIQRRTFFIKPKFQIRFIVYVMSWTLIALALFYISQQYFFYQSYLSGEELGLAKDHPYFQLLNDQQAGLSKIFFITSLVICTLILFSALFFSHRIAGPLYRMEVFLREGAQDPEKLKQTISFREKDFFQEIPEALNEVFKEKNDDPEA